MKYIEKYIAFSGKFPPKKYKYWVIEMGGKFLRSTIYYFFFTFCILIYTWFNSFVNVWRIKKNILLEWENSKITMFIAPLELN